MITPTSDTTDEDVEVYALIEEMANDLEDYINQQYPVDQRGYPSIARKYAMDIAIVIRARKYLGLIGD